MKILGVVIVLVASAWVGLFLTAKTVTLEEAEQIAIQKVQRSAERLRFNAAVFRGPELVDVQAWGYAFRWVFSDGLLARRIRGWPLAADSRARLCRRGRCSRVGARVVNVLWPGFACRLFPVAVPTPKPRKLSCVSKIASSCVS
jgi:hypothetical protein